MLYIHNIRDMKILHTIRDTPLNVSSLYTGPLDIKIIIYCYSILNIFRNLWMFTTLKIIFAIFLVEWCRNVTPFIIIFKSKKIEGQVMYTFSERSILCFHLIHPESHLL